MSTESQAAEQADEQPTTPPQTEDRQAENDQPRKPRRLWRWTKRLTLLALIGAIALRLALPFVLPKVLAGPLSERGLAMQWERLDLSMLGGHLELWHVDLWKGESDSEAPVDGSGMAHVEYLLADLDISALFTGRLHVHRLEVDGADVRLERDAEGQLDWIETFAGGESEPEAEAEEPQEDEGPTGLLDALPENLDFPVSLGAARLQHIRLTFVDAVSEVQVPPTEFQLRVSDIGHDRRNGRFSMSASSSGLIDRLQVEGPVGFVDAQGAGPEGQDLVCFNAQAELELLGLRPGKITPLLAELGLEPRANTVDASGTLTLKVGPGRRIALGADGLSLSADGESAAELESFELSAEQLGEGEILTVTEARVSNGEVRAARESSGSLAFGGLALVGTAAPDSPPDGPTEEAAEDESATTEEQSETAPTQSNPPRLALPELRLENLTAHFDDRAIDPPTALSAELERLVLSDIELGAPVARPIAVDLLVHLPEVLTDASATGELDPFSDQPSARFDLRGSGLSLAALDPYLSAAGIENRWSDGQCSAQVLVRSERTGKDLSLFAEIGEVRLGSEELGQVASLDSLTLEGLQPGEEFLSIERIALAGAQLGLEFDPQGPWRALGLASAPPEFVEDPDAVVAPAFESLGIVDGNLELNQLTLGQERIDGVLSGSMGLGEWIEGLNLQLEFAGTPNDLEAEIDLALQGWQGETLARFLGAPAPPAGSSGSARATGRINLKQLDGDLSAEASFGALQLSPPPMVAGSAPLLSAERLDVSVSLTERDGVQSLGLEQRVQGLTAGGWAGYLPPGVDLELSDASFVSSAAARLQGIQLPAIDATEMAPAVEAESATGIQLDVGLSGLFDGDGNMLLGFEELSLRAPLLAARAVEIESVALQGTRVVAHRDANGVLHLPGLKVAKTPEAPTPTDDSSAPANQGESAPVAASGRGSLPANVSLNALDLELAEVRFTDAMQPELEPLLLSARLSASEPWQVYDAEAESQSMLPLAVEFQVGKLLRAGRVDLQVSPFDERPEVAVQVQLEGIAAEQALAWSPALRERIAVTELTDGEFRAEMLAALDLRRRGPLDFDLSQGCGLEFELREVALLGSPGQPPLLGLDNLRVEASQLQPVSSDFRIRSIEITGSQARVARRNEGLEVAGLLLKTATPSGGAEAVEPDGPDGTEAGESDTEQPPVSDASAEPADAQPADTQPEAAPMRLAVGEILATGLDLRIVDTTGDVPMVIPLDELDFELRGFDTGAPAKPVRFNLLVGSADVELPERAPEQNLVSGLAGFAIDMVDGVQTAERVMLSRPVFEDFTVSGQVQLGGPEGDGPPTGWTQVNLTGFELLAARGPAGASGVTITDGVMDLTAKARLRGEKGLRVDTRTTLGHLALAEPADGPISSWLRLPAPLDSVIFLLKDNAGEVTLPFDVELGDGSVSVTQLATEAVTVLTQVIATAVASSPLRVAGGLTDFLGLGGGGEEAPQLEEVELQFPVGLDLLTPQQIAQIGAIAQRFRSDSDLVGVATHVLGAGDLARAEALANPSPEARDDLHHRLQARRSDLERKRTELAAEIRSQWLVGLAAEAEASRRRLSLIDAELLAAENALDRVLELLSPRAERNRDRRTRQVALAIAELRLAELERQLDEAGLPEGVEERLRIQLPRFQVDEELEGGALRFTLKL